MYIIVGLGNPGRKYEKTRHNMGFIAVDYLAGELGIKVTKIKHKALIGEGMLSGHKVLLVKPQTYMNLSGNSVREIVEYYKLPLEKLIVIYDDIDIPVGTVRVRKKGSAGTHNGMKSVIYDVQSDLFPRIRIGIGGRINIDLKDYVTAGVGKGEQELLRQAVIKAAAAGRCIVEKGIDKAMNEYNIRPKALGEEKKNGNEGDN